MNSEDMVDFLSDVWERNIEPYYQSEPIEQRGTMEKNIPFGEYVKIVVADSFRDDIIRTKNDQLLMLCNDKAECDFYKKTFAYIAKLAKDKEIGLEFVYMNGDNNEVFFTTNFQVQGLIMARQPHFYIYLNGYKYKRPKDFDLPFKFENLVNWLKVRKIFNTHRHSHQTSIQR